MTEGGNGLGGLDPERTVQYRPGPDDASAVEGLGELAARGAAFLVIPRSAFGWLAQRPLLQRSICVSSTSSSCASSTSAKSTSCRDDP